MGLGQFDEKAAILTVGVITPGNTTTVQQIVAANTQSPQRLDYIWAINQDTVDHLVDMQLGSSPLGVINVPAGAGTTNHSAVDVLKALLLATDLPYITLPVSTNLQAKVEVTLNTAKNLYIVCMGGTVG